MSGVITLEAGNEKKIRNVAEISAYLSSSITGLTSDYVNKSLHAEILLNYM